MNAATRRLVRERAEFRCEYCRIHEDDEPYSFHLEHIIPKKHIRGVKEAGAEDAEVIGYSHLVAARIARERGIEDGYRTVYNVGPRSGQSVFHLHLHLIGGRDMKWPPG